MVRKSLRFNGEKSYSHYNWNGKSGMRNNNQWTYTKHFAMIWWGEGEEGDRMVVPLVCTTPFIKQKWLHAINTNVIKFSEHFPIIFWPLIWIIIFVRSMFCARYQCDSIARGLRTWFIVNGQYLSGKYFSFGIRLVFRFMVKICNVYAMKRNSQSPIAHFIFHFWYFSRGNSLKWNVLLDFKLCFNIFCNSCFCS